MRSNHLFFFLTAADRLVNPNARWQNQSDQGIFNMGLEQCKEVLQLFYYKMQGKIVLIVAKLVADLKAAGRGDNAIMFTKKFNESFELGTTWKLPGRMRCFDLNIEQFNDYSVKTNADDNLEKLQKDYVSGMRRKEHDDKLNKFERKVGSLLDS